jgi:universal stress protein E
MALSNIFIIIDPSTARQPAFERGIESARDTGALLHLYLCDSSGNTDENESLMNALLAQAKEEGQEAVSELEFSDADDWPERAVAASTRCGASMIFKNCFDHNAAERELRNTSDWTLLRTSNCPVLMVKDFHDWSHRRVLAGINPASREEAHIKLDDKIISLAKDLAAIYGSDAHFVNAFQDLNRPPEASKIAQRCGADVEHVHLRKGRAADVIRDTAAELGVDLVIVGTVARDGIKGRVVGNTCERLLDQTHSDLLVLN